MPKSNLAQTDTDTAPLTISRFMWSHLTESADILLSVNADLLYNPY